MECLGVFLTSNYIANLSVPDCFRVVSAELLRGFSGRSYDLWVIGGQQYSDCVRSVDLDARFSGVALLQLSGVPSSGRVAVAIPGFHEARYLHGILCAEATKTKVVGYVTSVPFTNNAVSRGLSAFTVGVKSMDPSIKVVVGLTGSFLFPVAEEKATETLIKAGADCIAQHQNDLTVNSVSSDYGVYSLGYASDARFFGDENVLSSMEFTWDPLLLYVIRLLLNNTWMQNLTLTQGYSVGSVALTGYSTKVEKAWREPIDALIPAFVNESFNVFCTPHFNDPQWIDDPNRTYSPSPGVTCLTATGILDMTGIIRDAHVLVQYNDTHTPYIVIWIFWSSPGAIVLCLLCSVLIALSIASVFDVIWNRHSPVYRAASPLFCMLILSGIIIAAIGPIFWIGPRNKYNCMVPYWLIGVGYALIYSCLLAKNWRIWRIFSRGHFKIVAIMDMQLVTRWVAVIVGIEVLILIFWTVFDPQLPYQSSSTEIRYDQLQEMCVSKSRRTIGIGVYMAYNVALLIPVSIIAYWTRVAKDEYRETRAIASTVYMSFLLLLAVIATVIAIPNMYNIFFYLSAYGTWGLLAIVYYNIFIPKVWRAHVAKSSPMTSRSSAGAELSTINSNNGLESQHSITNPRSQPQTQTQRSLHNTE